MRVLFLTMIAVAFTGCTPTAREPEAPHLAETLKLKSLLLHQDAALAEWLAATPAHRETCEISAGDCRLQVSEKREEFLRRQGIATCKMPDPEQEARCIADYRLKRGDVNAATDYFSASQWCLDQMVECTKAEQKKSATNAQAEKTAAHKRDVENSAAGLAARARIGFAAEKVAYLRATLPPNADHECSELQDRSDCIALAQTQQASLSAEYEKGDKTFDEKHAVAMYSAETEAEAQCFTGALECLNARLSKYGEMAESRVFLEQVFAVLEKRQLLVEQLGHAASLACLEQTTNEHQPAILKAYQAYAHEPVLYFRTQLHRTFLALHQAQLTCLTQTLKSAN